MRDDSIQDSFSFVDIIKWWMCKFVTDETLVSTGEEEWRKLDILSIIFIFGDSSNGLFEAKLKFYTFVALTFIIWY